MGMFTEDDIKAICCSVCTLKIEIETSHLVDTIHRFFKSCIATSMDPGQQMMALLSS